MKLSTRLAALTLAVGLGLSGCYGAMQESGYLETSVSDVHRIVSAGEPPKIIDVREPHEFAAGHVPGAINVPLGGVAAWASSQDKDTPYLLICQSGRRSATASQQLVEQGFTRVTNVTGGTAAWIGEGLPVER